MRKIGNEDIVLIKKAAQYLKPHKKLFVLMVIVLIMQLLLGLAQPLVFARVIDSVIESNLNKTFIMVIATFALMVLAAGLSALSGRLMIMISNRIIFRLRTDLFENIVYMPLSAFDKMKKGEFLSRFEGDIQSLAQILTERLSEFFLDIIRLFAIGVIILVVNFKMALFLIAIVPLSYVIFSIYGKKMRKQSALVRMESDNYMSFLQEALTGIREIKKLLIEKKIILKMSYVQKKYIIEDIRKDTLVIMAQFVNTCFVSLGIAAIFLFGAEQISIGALTLGNFVAFNNYSSNFQGAFIRVTKMNVRIQETLISIKRIFELFDKYSFTDCSNERNNIYLKNKTIDFQNVVFAYDKDDILKDLTFHINENTYNVIVGANGCGKTTIFNLLIGFYKEKGGVIKLGGINKNILSVKELRSYIGYVSQEPFMFDDTIKANLLYAREDATDDEIKSVCKQVGLHDYIETLDHKYDTELGELGKRFSTGQRQRLEIAKILLADKKILLLDEPTSALDIESKIHIISLLKKIKSNHTILVISHDADVIKSSDKILYICNGILCDQGKHDELIERNREYKMLIESQS